MKRISIVAVMAVLGVRAATVPQTSAEDYRFSRPNLPSNIVGQVIGDPPAYHVMRSEDVAWLREAYAERVALMGYAYNIAWNGLPQIETYEPRFGKWPLSWTNRFAYCTTATEPLQGGSDTNSNLLATNVIVGYVVVTNLGTGVDSARIKEVELWADEPGLSNTNHIELGYLTTDDGAYVSSTKAWRSDDADWNTTEQTNIFDRTIRRSGYTNCSNTILMVLTNHTVSVWTNSWREFVTTNARERVTNIVYRGQSLVNCIFANRVIEGYGKPQPGPLRGPYDYAAITNHYDFLKGLTRLARTPSLTETVPVIVHQYSMATYPESEYDYEDTYDYTNLTASLPFVEVTCAQSSGKEYLDRESWTIGSRSSKGFLRQHSSGRMTYHLSNPRSAAIIDGQRHVVSSARLYALVRAEYSEDSYTRRITYRHYNHVDEVVDEEWPNSYGTNYVWTCVVPCGAVNMSVGVTQTNTITNLCFTVSSGMDILTAAWSATDAPSQIPESETFPSLMYECPSLSHDDDKGTWTETTTQSSCGYSAQVLDFKVLLDFAPRTMLPGW